MKKGDPYKQAFIDILFEGRNKEYGAYYLRIHERKYLFRSLFMTCVFLILLLFFPDIISFLKSQRHESTEFVYIPIQQDVLPKGDITMDYVPPPPPQENPNIAPKVVQDPLPEPFKTDNKKPDPNEATNTNKNSKDTTANKRPTGDPNSQNVGITMVMDQRPTLNTQQYHSFQDYIRANTKLPESESILRHSGRVIVTVLFTADGLIEKAWVSQGLTPVLNNEALRVVKSMPRVNPARSHGRAIAVYVKIPVDFIPPDGLAKGK